MSEDACTVVRVREVEARCEPFDWAWACENRAAIDAHWSKRRSANPRLFNGPVLLVARHSVESAVLRAAFFETDFAAFLAFIDWGFPDPSVANGFAMPALQAADGAFLLGVMGAGTINAGRIYFPAGTPDRTDLRPDGTVDLAGSAIRELGEETGLGPSDYVVAEDWVVIRERGFLAFMRPVVINDAAAQAQARIRAFLAREKAPELADVVVVRSPDEIDRERTRPFVAAYIEHAFARAGGQR